MISMGPNLPRGGKGLKSNKQKKGKGSTNRVDRRRPSHPRGEDSKMGRKLRRGEGGRTKEVVPGFGTFRLEGEVQQDTSKGGTEFHIIKREAKPWGTSFSRSEKKEGAKAHQGKNFGEKEGSSCVGRMACLEKKKGERLAGTCPALPHGRKKDSIRCKKNKTPASYMRFRPPEDRDRKKDSAPPRRAGGFCKKEPFLSEESAS